MAKQARQGSSENVTELKTIHQKLTTSMADLTAGRITPEQLDEISRVAERRIRTIEKRMKREAGDSLEPQ